jgi:hypothetical protein
MSAEHSYGPPDTFAADSAPSGLTSAAIPAPIEYARPSVTGYQPGAFAGGGQPYGVDHAPPVTTPAPWPEAGAHIVWQQTAPSPPDRRPARGNGWGRLLLGIAAAVLVAGGGGAFAANSYAEHTICGAIQTEVATDAGSAASNADNPATEAVAMRRTADQLRGYGRMLVFDSSLKSATEGLADDLDQIVDLERSPAGSKTGADTIGTAVRIAGSVNSHARLAQRACGLPVTDVFGS